MSYISMLCDLALSEFDPSLTSEAYRAILRLGLENLQRFRLPERFDYLAIEINHLHNIPRHMASETLNSHRYYFCSERLFYIEQLADVEIIDTDFLIRQYQPYWDVIRAQLSPYDPKIEASA